MKENGNTTITLALVGNKSDAIDDRKVSTEEAQSFAQDNDMLYIETSAKTGQNVPSAFEKVATQIYEKVENGEIDVNQESSGVRLGTGISTIHIDAQNTLSNKNRVTCC